MLSIMLIATSANATADKNTEPKNIKTQPAKDLKIELDQKLNKYDLSKRSDYGIYNENFSLYYNNFQSQRSRDTMGSARMPGQAKAMNDLQQSINGFQSFRMGPKGEGNADIYGFKARIPIDNSKK